MKFKSMYALAALALPPSVVLAQQGDGTRTSVTAHVVKPAMVDATPERMKQIKAPDGLKVSPFATGLKNIRVLAVAPSGTVYASRREEGDIIMLQDANGDGRADGPPRVVANRAGAHGIAIKDGKFYIVTVKEVFVADMKPDGTFGPLEMIIADLPDAGQHANRTIAFGPDGMLYISVGSTCNACNESNPENATILRATADGQQRTIFASGLRNTIGFAWHPTTGELWGLDHGIDDLGDDQQPEELNKIELGKQYGWPHVWGAGGITPQTTPVGRITKDQWKALSEPMALGYTAHSAPMQMVFARGGALPKTYDGDAFATMRGSWNRGNPSGYEVVRIHFADGAPQSIEPFVTGFLTDDGNTHIARPVGLAVAKDGALLVGDDANGVIYRVAAATTVQSQAVMPPATAMQQQAAKGVGVPLAFNRAETSEKAKAAKALTIQSANFTNGAALPVFTSEYADGVSPQLSWAAVAGAKSYAIVMEDPDAKPTTPFVHWVIWNIPASVTQLPQGLQENPRLTEPEGALQGRTSRGSVGYFGPRPPVGDPPHHYHFQVLALDVMLDVPPGADRDKVLAAASGHVIAKGNIVGTYQQQGEPIKGRMVSR